MDSPSTSIAMTDSFDSQEALANGFGPLELSNLESDVQLFNNNNTESTSFTVSPQDLTMNANHLTGPPSGDLFTNLSTPGSEVFDSPYAGYSNQYLGTNETLYSNLDDELDPEASNWAPLFASESSDSTNTVPSIEHESPVAMSRITSASGRFSTSVGIVKPSRRVTKPLVPLNPELESDPKNKKRMKNTEAARKSRAKKETERNEFLAENARLRRELELREADVAYWKGVAIAHGAAQS